MTNYLISDENEIFREMSDEEKEKLRGQWIKVYSGGLAPDPFSICSILFLIGFPFLIGILIGILI